MAIMSHCEIASEKRPSSSFLPPSHQKGSPPAGVNVKARLNTPYGVQLSFWTL